MVNNISKNKRIELQEKIVKIRHFLETVDMDNSQKEEFMICLDSIEKEMHTVQHYGLSFEEHEEEVDIQLKDNVPVLIKDSDLCISGEGRKNILLEGDNLASLYLLYKTYKRKIDLIYIDPPYNTQNKDFIYDDSRIDVNDGYRHSKWISFMEKRLKVAKKLLKETGVIFISIDDNEYAQLKLLCDEIFAENNFIATIIWEKAYAPVNLKKHFSESHDYILCYAKDKAKAVCNGLARTEEANDRYKNPDNDPRGPWKSSDLSVGPAVKDNIYEITTPSGRKVMPPSGYSWRLSKERFAEYVKDNRIWFGPEGKSVPSIKRFITEVKSGITPMTIWKYTDVGHSQSATQELKKLFDGQAKFTYPKPVSLIKRIVSLYGGKDSVVLDFFAGSGTTAQAVMEQNQEDGGNRTFILCTNNESDICRNVTLPRIIKAKEKTQSNIALNYYHIDFEDITDKLFYEYADKLLLHIQELVELENGIDIDEDKSIVVALSDEELSKIVNLNNIHQITKIYIANDVFITPYQEQILKGHNIEINVIPDYYYGELK